MHKYLRSGFQTDILYISGVNTDGSTTIKYSKGNTTEDVNLNDINLVLANGSFLILITHQNITVLIQDKEIHFIYTP